MALVPRPSSLNIYQTIAATILVMFTGPLGIGLLLAFMGLDRWREVGRITVYAIAIGMTGAWLLHLALR